MIVKSKTFTSQPDSTSLSNFRAAWKNAYIEWQKVELFDLGPSNDVAMRLYFNIYPTDVAGIETNVASGNSNFGIEFNRQGFPALDYLINGMGTDAETIDKYKTATDANKRIAYLNLVTNKMKEMTTSVISAWQNGYRNSFVGNTSVSAGSPLSGLINGYVRNYEKYIRTGKFGLPSGVMAGDGAIYASKVEGYYKKDISLDLAKAAHKASVDFFNGKSVITGAESRSLKRYLDEIGARDSKTGASLSSIINSQFGEVDKKLNLLSNNFVENVNTNNQAMIDVYNTMQSTIRLLKVDMTSAMSISISYTDTDGD
ncbi:MAG TPA: peptidase M75, Imelysin [Cytophagales bacterium]|nr:peptidase M75, Imelysin [Cytophagales bacterium]